MGEMWEIKLLKDKLWFHIIEYCGSVDFKISRYNTGGSHLLFCESQSNCIESQFKYILYYMNHLYVLQR